MSMDEASEHWYERKSDYFADRRSSTNHSQSPREQAGDTAAASTAPVWKGVSCSPANLADQPTVTDWIPLVSMPDRLDFVGFSASSHGAGTSGGCLIEQIQRRLHLGNENMSEILNSFSLAEELQVAADAPGIIGKDPKAKKRKMIQELGASDFQSKIHKTQAAEAEPKNERSPESVKSRKEKDAKKSKGEKNSEASSHKLHSKRTKDSAANGDTPTEDYIHVRAKRGQATNSHSLAERLRREKISERMRFLQDLVPGCSKITGKAVMLDEIINYVQSLQRQVEFLSMKLATVSSEQNHDIHEILSKNIFFSQTGGSSFLRCGPGFSTPYHQFQQPARQGSTQLEVDHNLYQISPAVQMPNVWDEGIQDVMHISFLPSTQPDPSIQLPGYTKTEQ